MKLVDKDTLVAEIERMLHETVNNTDGSPYYGGRAGAFTSILSFINALEVKDVDLEKEIQRQYNVHKNPDNSIVKDCVIMTEDGFEYFAKHFFELGLKTQKGEEV